MYSLEACTDLITETYYIKKNFHIHPWGNEYSERCDRIGCMALTRVETPSLRCKYHLAAELKTAMPRLSCTVTTPSARCQKCRWSGIVVPSCANRALQLPIPITKYTLLPQNLNNKILTPYSKLFDEIKYYQSENKFLYSILFLLMPSNFDKVIKPYF